MMAAGQPQAEAFKRTAGWEAWWALAVLCLFYVLSFLDRHLLSMMVDPIKRDLGIGDFEMGLILGPAFGVALGICALPLGWFVDRYPRRKIIFLGVGFWSLATAACGVAQSALGLGLARGFVGASEAVLSPAANSMLSDKFPRERLTLALAIFQSSNKLGSAAAFGLGGLLIGLLGATVVSIPILGDVRPWQLIFFMVGIPGSVAALLIYTVSEPPRRGRRSAEPPRAGALVAYLKENRRLMILLYSGFMLIAICGFALIAWVPTFAARRYGLEPVEYGPLLSVANLLGAGALIVKGAFVDWLYSRGHKDANVVFFSWLTFACTPLVVGAFFLTSPWLFFIAYGVMVATTIPVQLYLCATLASLAPNELRGQLIGLAYTLQGLVGMSMGPTLVGAITDFAFHDEDKIGWSLALLCGIAMPIGAMLLRAARKPVREAVLALEAIERGHP